MLTDKKIKELKWNDKDEMLTDSPNLHLLLTRTAKLWRCRFSFNGTQKILSLGKYPHVSIFDARAKRDDVLRLLAQGIDPSKERKKEKIEAKGGNFFSSIAQEWLQHKNIGEKTRNDLKRRLELHILPKLGNKKIQDIDTQEVIALCRKVDSPQVARRVLSLIQSVFRYAKIIGIIKYSPIEGINEALPVAKNNHHPCIIDKYHNFRKRKMAIGQLLIDIKEYKNGADMTKKALYMLAMIFCRPMELCQMKWVDIDLQEKVWRFTSTKTDTKIVTPLADQAINILLMLKEKDISSEYVFPHRSNRRKHISINTLKGYMYTIGYKDVHVPHGFRAVARTVLEENLKIPNYLIEMQLGHKTTNPLGRAYERTHMLDERRVMMQKWADYIDECIDFARKLGTRL
ncbi:integrase [Nitrosomonas nitrosa]|uniref:tyrosine-type recombinase/integrase n=1 Tax=Nitrosomonas nitrosa TaxID=52442 RepID=UPI000D318F77|nr:integrase arm-type DNA-binding domain-containing protein [Nitrosomonas nitrosa]PTR04941.1 integrase [Nitrosomonas nitrosa]